jgi:serine/threonine-protein kinase RsbW
MGLAQQCHPQGVGIDVKEMIIPSEWNAVRDVEERLLTEISRHGYSEASVFAIKLALEEGLANAICHGNRRDPAKKVQVVFDVDDTRTIITITDQGPGFDPKIVPDPTTDENLEKPNGRGIMLMRAYMDEICYNAQGNQVRIVKRNT